MRMGPTTSRRAWTGAVAVVLATVLMAGCSGGGAAPRPGPTVTSASPSESPTPTVSATPDASIKPERPAAMDKADAAGAEAAAEYLLNLYPYVYATNDLTVWKALSHPDCVFCKSVSDHVKEQIAAGSHSTGGLVTISSVKSTVINPGKWWSVDVELTQAPSSTLDAYGKVVESSPKVKAYTMNLAIVYESKHWVVRELSYTRTK